MYRSEVEWGELFRMEWQKGEWDKENVCSGNDQEFPRTAERHLSSESESQRSSGKINRYKSISRPIRVKVQTMKDNVPLKRYLDLHELSSKTLETIQQWKDIFKIMKENHWQLTTYNFLYYQNILQEWSCLFFSEKFSDKIITDRIHQF